MGTRKRLVGLDRLYYYQLSQIGQIYSAVDLKDENFLSESRPSLGDNHNQI